MATNKLEIKFVGVKALGEREFTGHGSTFGNIDLGGDIVLAGAFRKSLDKHRRDGTAPLMFFGHDPNKIPGKWLEISEDANGLVVHGVLAPTPLGDEVHALLKMGAIGGLSIGYRVVKADYDRDGNRLLQELDLAEVSVVSMPMNPKATVTAAKRADLAANIKTVRDYEHMVREVFGLSRSGAVRLASKTWPAFAEAIGADIADEAKHLSDEFSEAAAVAILRASAATIRSI